MVQTELELQQVTVTIKAPTLDDGRVQVAFRDTDVGMTADATAKAFDPFYSTIFTALR